MRGFIAKVSLAYGIAALEAEQTEFRQENEQVGCPYNPVIVEVGSLEAVVVAVESTEKDEEVCSAYNLICVHIS